MQGMVGMFNLSRIISILVACIGIRPLSVGLMEDSKEPCDDKMNGSGLQQGLVHYNYNKIVHIVKYYRERNGKCIDLEKK